MEKKQRRDFLYQELKEKYKKNSINKQELANELNISEATISYRICKGIDLPAYRKSSPSKNSKVFFHLIDVADYLSNTIKIA